MSEVRAYLRGELEKKVASRGLVVWEDPQGEYAKVVEDVLPDDAALLCWEGSWYRLRRAMEPLIGSAEPPRLVVYLPVETPAKEADPLAEAREAGTVFKLRLRTLLKEALGGKLTEARIAELSNVRTLEEAEAALGASEGTGVRLPAILGTTDTLQLCLRILADDTDELLTSPELWEEARSVLGQFLGGEPTGEGEALRDRVFRHLVLTELGEALGSLPEELERHRGPSSADQRRRAVKLLRDWRSDLRRLAAYRERARRAEMDLGLRDRLPWDDRLSGLDTVPVLEEFAKDRVLELLAGAEAEAAARLARDRLGSIWARAGLPEASRWEPLWEILAAVADLNVELAQRRTPAGTAGEILEWYAEEGWRVDRAHRRMESALLEAPEREGLDEVVTRARSAYEGWLEVLLERFTGAVESGGLERSRPRQVEVHQREVAVDRMDVGASSGPLAYVLVDALRYELGLELADALRRDHPDVQVSAAVASAPTITPVGMASLMPGAELGVRLSLSPRGDVEVAVNGQPVRGVPDRVGLLRAAHGEVADLTLSDVLEAGERSLAERVKGSRLMVLRSQEIDEAFESGEMAAWAYVTQLRDLLAKAVARLRAAGIGRFVIAADHGFLILSREVGSSRVIPAPGGQGALHRRCWVGKGGQAAESALRVPVQDLGAEGDLDLVVPRGLAIFAAGGARRFFHGGLSPQELLVPVILVTTQAAAAVPSTVRIEVAGGRITTGVFSASVALEPNLFTGEVVARVSARDRSGEDVARLVAGEGYDETTGVVRLRTDPQAPQVLTFRVVKPLRKGERVTLEVYDSATDRRLAESKPAEVVSDVRVGDGLD